MGNGLRYHKKNNQSPFGRSRPSNFPPLIPGVSATRALPRICHKNRGCTHEESQGHTEKVGGWGFFVELPLARWSLKETVPTVSSKLFLFWKNGRFWMNVSFGKREFTTLTFYTWSPFSPQICQVILQSEAQQLYPVVRYVTYIIDTDTPSHYGSVFSCTRWLTCLSSPRHWDVQLFPSFAEHFLKKGNLWHQGWSKISGSYPFTKFYKAICRGEMGGLKRPMGTPCFDEKGALEASQDVPRHDIQNPKECNRIPSSSKNNNGEFMFDNIYIYIYFP